MPRTARASVGGMCYHVLNRGNGRLFERILGPPTRPADEDSGKVECPLYFLAETPDSFKRSSRRSVTIRPYLTKDVSYQHQNRAYSPR